ncbi:serine hydrolase [Phytomonospora endophytica]|uniref:CubicO group peptidase (Beta-lactamase class C family) n=1 Tax=Phytomonospora endophytica TaxID=714109 RepID=A0A841FTD2_9ACTN|nr:serine hydrolase [Phytomonospora endophytica]MBB6036802.1 CubicO group peptidase (beta-lactamase class C family) [Phytomonospora endophytica]GIG68164.1 serine hydrolase [Phytomonospora endophytica]
MTAFDEVSDWITRRLPDLLTEHKVVGAAVAVLADGRVVEAAAGSANLRAGIPATTDTLFQIGSVTKIWTTTLIMRLVDEGLVELDASVVKYLPEFRTAEPDTSARVTVRQLLSHTSGFEGDVFKDTGPGDDAVARFIAEILPSVAQTLPPGVMFSYNNAGFCVLGRIVEVVRGTTWSAAIHGEIAGPLGIRVATGPGEAILHRAAVGHIEPEPDAAPEVAAVWGLPASNGPAGAMLSTSARELLAFARMHLDGGVTPHGTRLLSEESVLRTRVPEAEIPRRSLLPGRLGLGWHLYDLPGGEVIGHDGNTIGQSAFMRLVPGKGIAVVLLTNGGDAVGLYRKIFGRVLGELAGMELPPPLVRPEKPVPVANVERYTGSYESSLQRFDVTAADGRLWMETTIGPDLADLSPAPPRRELLHVEDDLFVGVTGDDDQGMPLVFVESTADGRAAYLHNHRANPRVA